MLLHVTSSGETAMIRVSGKVGWENSRVLDRQVDTILKSGAKRLVFDLGDVEFLSSGAIGVISYNWRRLKEISGEILILNPNDYVLYLFKSVGFLRVFEGRIFESTEALDAALLERGATPLGSSSEHWESIDSTFDDDDELSYREDKPDP